MRLNLTIVALAFGFTSGCAYLMGPSAEERAAQQAIQEQARQKRLLEERKADARQRIDEGLVLIRNQASISDVRSHLEFVKHYFPISDMPEFYEFEKAAETYLRSRQQILAATSCDRFVGAVVNPLSFDAALNSVKSVPPKGEFETSAGYEERVKASGAPTQLIVAKPLEDGDQDSHRFLRYDADNSELTVVKYAFNNEKMNVWEAGPNSDPPFRIGSSVRSVALGHRDRNTGSYIGSNAFGVQKQITKISRTANFIVEPNSERSRSSLFPILGHSDRVLGRLSMSIDQAKAVKGSGSLAFVITPSPPFKTSSTYVVQEPTINSPLEIVQKAKILVGEFQCSLVLDPRNNKVLASYRNW